MFIPANVVDEETLKDLFEHLQFDNFKCKRCKFMSQRPVKHCWTCEGYLGKTRLYSKKQTASGIYFGVPLAQWRKVREVLNLENAPVKDMRPRIPFPQDLEWTGKLHDGSIEGTIDQTKIVDDFWNNVLLKKREAGIIQCPPRSGKIYISTHIAVELGFRTVILASELAWIQQFVDALIEMTNIAELENAVVLVSNKRSSKFYKNKAGVLVVDNVSKVPKEACIVLVAYQAYIHDDDKVLKYLHGQFTTLILDECVSAKTLVNTDNGLLTAKKVHDEVSQGKTLKALSCKDGLKSYENITKSWPVRHRQKIIIHLDNGETVECSARTRIWSNTKQAYVYAKDVMEGEDIG
jgi:hypothetical protein